MSYTVSVPAHVNEGDDLTISITAAAAGSKAFRWALVPKGSLPIRSNDVATLSGTTDRIDFTTGNLTQQFTISTTEDTRPEPDKTMELVIWEVVPGGGDSDDVEIGRKTVTLTDDDYPGSENRHRFQSGNSEKNIITLGTTDSITANGLRGDDVFVVTRHQHGDVLIRDPFYSQGGSNTVALDYGVTVTGFTEGPTAFGVVTNISLSLSTGATITITNPEDGFDYIIGENSYATYDAFKTALTGFLGGDLANPVEYRIKTFVFIAGVVAGPNTTIFSGASPADVYSAGSEDRLQLNGIRGDDSYIITRFQKGSVTIRDHGGQRNLIKLDAGVSIIGVDTGAEIFGAPSWLKLTLATGAVVTVHAPKSGFVYQIGDNAVISYDDFHDAVHTASLDDPYRVTGGAVLVSSGKIGTLAATVGQDFSADLLAGLVINQHYGSGEPNYSLKDSSGNAVSWLNLDSVGVLSFATGSDAPSDTEVGSHSLWLVISNDYYDEAVIGFTLTLGKTLTAGATATAYDDWINATASADTIDGLAGSDTVSWAGNNTAVTIDLSFKTVEMETILTGWSSASAPGVTAATDGAKYIIASHSSGSWSFSLEATKPTTGEKVVMGQLNGLAGGATTGLVSGHHPLLSYNTATNALAIADMTLGGGWAAGDRLKNIENLKGSTGKDSLRGDSGDNIFMVSGGADKVHGGGGTDTLSFADRTSRAEVRWLGNLHDNDGYAVTASSRTKVRGVDNIVNIDSESGGFPLTVDATSGLMTLPKAQPKSGSYSFTDSFTSTTPGTIQLVDDQETFLIIKPQTTGAMLLDIVTDLSAVTGVYYMGASFTWDDDTDTLETHEYAVNGLYESAAALGSKHSYHTRFNMTYITGNIIPGDIEVYIGTDYNDLFRAGMSKGVIFHGGGGNDIIDGGYKDDEIHGGEGNDSIGGGFGDDIIYGGPGNDWIDGGSGGRVWLGNLEDHDFGDDIIYGGEGADTIHVGGGNNTVYGGPDYDYMVVAHHYGGNIYNGFDRNSFDGGSGTNEVGISHNGGVLNLTLDGPLDDEGFVTQPAHLPFSQKVTSADGDKYIIVTSIAGKPRSLAGEDWVVSLASSLPTDIPYLKLGQLNSDASGLVNGHYSAVSLNTEAVGGALLRVTPTTIGWKHWWDTTPADLANHHMFAEEQNGEWVVKTATTLPQTKSYMWLGQINATGDGFVGGAYNHNSSKTEGIHSSVFHATVNTISLDNEFELPRGTIFVAAGSPDQVSNAGSRFKNVQNIWGGHYHDILTGSNDSNSIWGNNGSDTLRGLGGDDWLNGGHGWAKWSREDSVFADWIDGGSGTDTLSYWGEPDDLKISLNNPVDANGFSFVRYFYEPFTDTDLTGDGNKYIVVKKTGQVWAISLEATLPTNSFHIVLGRLNSNANGLVEGHDQSVSLVGGTLSVKGGGSPAWHDFAFVDKSDATAIANDHIIATRDSGGFWNLSTTEQNALPTDRPYVWLGQFGADGRSYAGGLRHTEFYRFSWTWYDYLALGSGGIDTIGHETGDRVRDIENVQTGDGDDHVTGNDEDNEFWTAGGSDVLIGLGGNDYLQGEGGADMMDGGEGLDVIAYWDSTSAVTASLDTPVASDGYQYLVSWSAFTKASLGSGDANKYVLATKSGNSWVVGLHASQPASGVYMEFGQLDAAGTALKTGAHHWASISGGNLRVVASTQGGGHATGDAFKNIEGLSGSNFWGDYLFGKTGELSYLFGWGGNDHLDGNPHKAYLWGGEGNDTFHLIHAEATPETADTVIDFKGEKGTDSDKIKLPTGTAHLWVDSRNNINTGNSSSGNINDLDWADTVLYGGNATSADTTIVYGVLEDYSEELTTGDLVNTGVTIHEVV